MLKERIAQTLRLLAPRDRDVIELRFGLRDGWAYTLEDVAHILGITRERVRQIEARACGIARVWEQREPGCVLGISVRRAGNLGDRRWPPTGPSFQTGG